MMTRVETRRALAGGVIGLAGILVFAGLACLALLNAGLGGDLAGIYDPYLGRVLRFTLLQAILSALLSVLLAIPFARALARQPHFPGRTWIVRLLAVPLGLPVISGALGLISVWGRHGWVNDLLAALGLEQPISIYGLSGILIAHVFFNFPLAARLLLGGLERLPSEYWLIAANLGMPPRSLFRFVEWPQMRKQIPGIAGLILMLAATSFTLVLLLGGGPAATTLEVAIYQALRFDFDPQKAVLLALLQMAVTSVLLLLLSLVGGRSVEGMTSGPRPTRPDGKAWPRRLSDGLLLAAGLAFLGLPLLSILINGLQADLGKIFLDPLFHQALATSLLIALPAGLLSVMLAFILSSARTAVALSPMPHPAVRRLGESLPTLGSLILLVPPTVLGTGWFLLAGPARLEPLAPLLVVAINGLMAFPFVLRIIDPALTTHRMRTSRLAASLGIAGWNRLRHLDWPGLRRPLSVAFCFGTALSLGDLGVVALFGSERLVTLPWLLYSRMGSYRTTDAAGLALILAVICLLLTLGGTGAERESGRDGP